jgi:hypothetical protein
MHLLLWRYIWFCLRFWRVVLLGPEMVFSVLGVILVKASFTGNLASVVLTYANVGCGASVMLLGFVTRWATPGFLAHLQRKGAKKQLADVEDPERLTFRLTWSATVHWILILCTLFRAAVPSFQEAADNAVLFFLVYSFFNFLSVIALTGVVSSEWTRFRMFDNTNKDV